MGKRLIAVLAGFDFSMIQLHPDCRARLIETIADAIPSIEVNNGTFIHYASTFKLFTADKVIPASGKVQDQLTAYINETPVSTFIVDLLQSELLQLNQFQEDKPSMNLTDIVGYEDPRQVAEWPAPGLDDAWLSESCLPLELHRA